MVIAIIATLMAFTLPMVQGPGEGQKLRSAADSIDGMARYARQQALGRNTLTALVLIGKDGPETHALRSVAVFELQMPANGTAPTAADWKPLTAWRQFPLGVVFDPARSTFFDTPTLLSSPTLDGPLKIAGQNTEEFHYHIFLPNGRLLGNTTRTLTLIPGTVQATTLIPGGNASTHYLTLSLIASTGQTRYSQP